MDKQNLETFHFLEAIARDLSGEVNFPTWLDASLRIRNALRDAEVSLDVVARVVSVEPLIASKLLRLANSAAYRPAGHPITDVRTAVLRLGLQTVRTVALAVALDQMLRSKKLVQFNDISSSLWGHSVDTAAFARVLARRLTKLDPEEAMLAGLVHDIGVFYLLYLAADYPAVCDDRAEMLRLIAQWHANIGHAVLTSLELPEEITVAAAEHDRPRSITGLRTIADVVYAANRMAGIFFRGTSGIESTIMDLGIDDAACDEIRADAQVEAAELKTALTD